MPINNPDDLLKLEDLPRKEVKIKGVGEVLVRGLTAKERVDLDRNDEPDAAESLEFLIDVIMQGAIKEDGTKLFSGDKWRDWLRNRNQDTLTALFEPIMELSGSEEKKD